MRYYKEFNDLIDTYRTYGSIIYQSLTMFIVLDDKRETLKIIEYNHTQGRGYYVSFTETFERISYDYGEKVL